VKAFKESIADTLHCPAFQPALALLNIDFNIGKRMLWGEEWTL
jgi:hypothetical protein